MSIQPATATATAGVQVPTSTTDAASAGSVADGIVPTDTLNRLNKATTLAVGLGPVVKEKNSEVYSRFRRIERELQKINTVLPEIGSWETNLRAHLAALATQLDASMTEYNQNKNCDFGAKLRLIDASIKQVVSILPGNLDNSKAAQSTSQARKHQPIRPPPPRKLSLEWSELRVTEKLLWASLTGDLRVSYDNLDLRSKICLLCFSIFPEKAVVKKRALIYWWIGEGLVTARIRAVGDKAAATAEEVGEEVFAKLVDRGLIRPCNVKKEEPDAKKKDDDPSRIANGCEMHPWVRRMLISMAGEAKFFSFDSSGTGTPCHDSRRAFLIFGNREDFSGAHQNQNQDQQSSSSPSIPAEENLLTVFNMNEQFVDVGPKFLSNAKKIAVLQLGRWQYSTEDHIEVENENFLKGLGAPKNLKYISLRGISRITAIPACILKLKSLEILDLKACHNLEKLPPSVAPLRRLTHLDLSECYLLDGMPKGIEKLTRLQVLKGFVIGHTEKTPCRLGALSNLKKLRRLSIHIGSEAIMQKEEFRKLKDIESLCSLTISWGVNPEKWKAEDSVNKDSIKDLSFPPNLKKLDIRGIPEKEKPEWLNPGQLKNLKKLYIRGGELHSLVDQGNTDEWKVEILRLKYLKNLTTDPKELLLKFPHLCYLEVRYDQSKNDDSTEVEVYKNDSVMKESEIREEKARLR